MTPTEGLQRATADGLVLMPDHGEILVKAPTRDMLERWTPSIRAHRSELLQLLTAPEPDVRSLAPCPICGSHERWIWLDGRHICRVCLVWDGAPLTLLRQGWPRDREDVHAG